MFGVEGLMCMVWRGKHVWCGGVNVYGVEGLMCMVWRG